MQHPAAHLVVILCIQLIQKCMWEVYNYSFILFQPALLAMLPVETLFWGIDDLQIMKVALQTVFENRIQIRLEMVLSFLLYSAILVWNSILQLEG